MESRLIGSRGSNRTNIRSALHISTPLLRPRLYCYLLFWSSLTIYCYTATAWLAYCRATAIPPQPLILGIAMGVARKPSPIMVPCETTGNFVVWAIIPGIGVHQPWYRSKCPKVPETHSRSSTSYQESFRLPPLIPVPKKSIHISKRVRSEG